MATLSRYCKAYYVRDIRAFPGWIEPPISPAGGSGGGQDAAAATVRADDDIVYLHDDLALTDGVARDEGVLYESGGESWVAYCRDVLRFEVLPERSPDVVDAMVAAEVS